MSTAKNDNREFPEFPNAGYDIAVWFEERDWVAVASRDGRSVGVPPSHGDDRLTAVARLRGSLGLKEAE